MGSFLSFTVRISTCFMNFGLSSNWKSPSMNKTDKSVNISKSRDFKKKSSTQRSKSRYNYKTKKSENNSLDDIKGNLKKIFEFYTSYGERMNLKYMRSNKFLKLMQDVGIP